jgi:antitoxin (DNA-binding transcriptional repressor) of toxin-antitoxin stability system
MALDIPPHLVIIGAAKVAKAKAEFSKLVDEVAGENIIAQITAAGKTKLIADALKDVAYYGSQGSLWEVYVAVERIKLTPEMAPFLTEERRQNFKNRIITIISSL